MTTHDTVCLIIPPSAFLLDERVFPSLGVLKVAAELEKAGVPIEVLDLSGVKNFTDALHAHLVNSSAKVFGITATTPQMPAVSAISTCVRKVCPEGKIILGGTHATLVHAAAKSEIKQGINGRAQTALFRSFDMADVLVAGDGEKAIFAALNSSSRSMIDADNLKSEWWLKRGTLEEYPLPARHLIDMSSYHYMIDGTPATSLIAQLGCPFNCGFCGGRLTNTLRVTRTRNTESIVGEMVELYQKYGYLGFMFYDDELNVNPGLVALMEKITQAQETLGVKWRLRGFIKAELFTEEQAEAMYKAGFRWILVGFESGSPRILENIQKRATQEDNTRCVQIAKKCGLKVKALMSIGHPGESEKTVQQTKNWLLQVQPNDFDVTIITPYPGSPYYDEAVKTAEGVWTYTFKNNGDTLHQYEIDYGTDADYYKGNPDDGYVAHVFTDYLTSEQLVTLRGNMEYEIRQRLVIPFNPSAAAIQFEHSMGQHGALPQNILRMSK